MKLTLVDCAPPDQPGSMKEFGRMLEQALRTGGERGMAFERLPFYDPRPGLSMWQHHRWRLVKGTHILPAANDGWLHLLDGSMGAFIPGRFWSRTLVTVHDVIPALIQHGDLPGASPSLPARMLVRRSLALLRACKAIHVDSGQTGRDVARLTGRKDFTVIPLAVRSFARQRETIDLPARFMLHIGNNAAYKNRRGALEIFARFQAMQDVHLIMAGPTPDEELRRAAGNLSRVTFMNDVDDGTLATLYRKASLLLFPSIYEGFGMPVLEAMAHGCPVVCSDAGSLPEVAGDAALMAAPGEIDALARHGQALLEDVTLRESLVARGKARAATFSLSRMGNAFLDWYQRSTDNSSAA